MHLFKSFTMAVEVGENTGGAHVLEKGLANFRFLDFFLVVELGLLFRSKRPRRRARFDTLIKLTVDQSCGVVNGLNYVPREE
jgi:hypothetical protein